MKNREIIRLLKAHRGEVVGLIIGRDDYLEVKLVKSDLIHALWKQGDDTDLGLMFEVKMGVGYFVRDYKSDNQ